MAVNYNKARAWIAALTVTGVFSGTMYFAATNQDASAGAASEDTFVAAPVTDATAANAAVSAGQATAGPRATSTPKPQPTPVKRAKKTRGS